MDLKMVDNILKRVFEKAGSSELRAMNYEEKEFIDCSKVQKFTIGDYKALKMQIVNVTKFKSLMLFNYENLEIDGAVFSCQAQIPEVLLYIRDKDPRYIGIIAKKLGLTNAGVYKLIDRITEIYNFKLNSILDQNSIHKLLGLKK